MANFFRNRSYKPISLKYVGIDNLVPEKDFAKRLKQKKSGALKWIKFVLPIFRWLYLSCLECGLSYFKNDCFNNTLTRFWQSLLKCFCKYFFDCILRKNDWLFDWFTKFLQVFLWLNFNEEWLFVWLTRTMILDPARVVDLIQIEHNKECEIIYLNHNY